MRIRGWLAVVVASPLVVAAEGSARASEPHWSEGLVNAAGERMVLMPHCPASALLAGERRCFSSRLVTETYANQRLLDLQAQTERRRVIPLASSCTSSGGGTPVTTPPVGFRAQDLQQAYGLDAAGMPSGAGTVVAIVDACADTTIVADVKAYRDQFGLGPLPECGGANGVAPTKGAATPCIGVVSQTGTATLPPQDDGWAGEIALDVDMVSAACPSCSILLVEANSASPLDLDKAVNYAAAHADSVTNSYGSTETGADSTTAYTHAGVLIAAASGDSDYYNEIQLTQTNPSDPSTWTVAYNPQGANTPASMPGVLSVGGTTASNSATSPTGFTDAVWSHQSKSTKYPNLTGKFLYGGGSGCSQEFAAPAFQSVLAGKTGSCTMRASVDLSAAADYVSPLLADGGTGGGGGILVYQGSGGWAQVVGTSAATPFVTALFTRIGYASKPISAIYAKSDTFHDVTTGNNDPSGTCTDVNCNAGPGWDGPTGWGTPSAAAMLGLDAGTFVPDAGEDGGSVSDASSGDGSATGDGGNTGDDGGPAGGGNPDGSAVDGGGGNGFGGPGGSSGCGCTTPSSSPLAPTGLSLVAIAGLVAISARRRRR